ncbi:hypothetical protein J056_001276 [Wallemia ichthyophaga EXF-994]|uniref:Uncharacterized protein n=2 Tax=Wallemia ichthyophaga TaxID=245174 RepID=A0A4T0JLP1_WALIC|nr:uncharacterized protein J056_001276 [Wallemia ichthyophaga EXF-994]EOR00047.1 hypothetical protein J056_001276 [Wallemia ichthyophaga EXF-994]TIB34279.1 hypothetical protein E3P84_01850 [Wallemia ichthyophaga]TIB40361.1 hypothetical protein E3P86_00725 [Wallemia ichthyophaga]TIB41635.1 hypothetical protein E3P83_01801 [Wallemia ichthyophaga]
MRIPLPTPLNHAGRAINTLNETLPQFFHEGLVDILPNGAPLYSPHVQLRLRQFSLPSLRGRGVYMRSAGVLRVVFVALHADTSVVVKGVSLHDHRHVHMGLIVNGTNRLTQQRYEWDVLFRYAFDEAGLVSTHEVLRIHPPPTTSVVEGLRAVLAGLIRERNKERGVVACGGAKASAGDANDGEVR